MRCDPLLNHLTNSVRRPQTWFSLTFPYSKHHLWKSGWRVYTSLCTSLVIFSARLELLKKKNFLHFTFSFLLLYRSPSLINSIFSSQFSTSCKCLYLFDFLAGVCRVLDSLITLDILCVSAVSQLWGRTRDSQHVPCLLSETSWFTLWGLQYMSSYLTKLMSQYLNDLPNSSALPHSHAVLISATHCHRDCPLLIQIQGTLQDSGWVCLTPRSLSGLTHLTDLPPSAPPQNSVYIM